MKRLFIIAIVAGIGLSACGQKLKESQVPAAARAAFQKTIPEYKGDMG